MPVGRLRMLGVILDIDSYIGRMKFFWLSLYLTKALKAAQRITTQSLIIKFLNIYCNTTAENHVWKSRAFLIIVISLLSLLCLQNITKLRLKCHFRQVLQSTISSSLAVPHCTPRRLSLWTEPLHSRWPLLQQGLGDSLLSEFQSSYKLGNADYSQVNGVPIQHLGAFIGVETTSLLFSVQLKFFRCPWALPANTRF